MKEDLTIQKKKNILNTSPLGKYLLRINGLISNQNLEHDIT